MHILSDKNIMYTKKKMTWLNNKNNYTITKTTINSKHLMKYFVVLRM